MVGNLFASTSMPALALNDDHAERQSRHRFNDRYLASEFLLWQSLLRRLPAIRPLEIKSNLSSRCHQFGRGGRDLFQVKRPLRRQFHHQRQRDVMHRNAALGLARLPSMMGVSVKDTVERIAIQRLFESAAAEEW